MNYVAFRFTDNDYHGPLKEAIEYIVENRTDELTLDSWREFALRGLVAFDSLRRIDNFTLEHPSSYKFNARKYFEETLVVSEVKNLQELGDSFEGYVFDKNTFLVFYQGY